MRVSPWTAGWLSLMFLASSGALSAQSTGFINTRPDCMPGIQNTINYIQGPDPILDSDGNVNILLDAGQCCTEGNWEGIFNLRYPAATPLATPRYYPIWASKNWGTDHPRREHEAAFPGAVKFQGKWRIVYSSTFFPADEPNRDRAARLDLDDLVTPATTAQVHNAWIEPVPPCQDLFSCTEPGSGILATPVIHPNGSLWVYHPDKNNAACPSGWMRHKIRADMTLGNPQGNGCLTFDGMTEAPSFISDIALGDDNKLYMLSTEPNEIIYFVEWVSDSTPLGRHWTRTTRRWWAPTHPLADQDWVYSVWDGGYLKDENRRIVEPRVVVSQISEGRTFEEIGSAALGRFQFYYWADAGASLPPNFGGEAHSCDTFEGHLDVVDCTQISGWAMDSAYPDWPISVDIYDGGQLLANVPADVFRQDLLNAGKGNGVHGFSIPLPNSLNDGNPHSIQAKFVGSDFSLTGSPRSLTCSCPLPVGHPAYCRDCGPCGDGEGDCDSNAECEEGLVCGMNVGADYGLPAHYDVCESKCQPGSDTLCFEDRRFKAELSWLDPWTGQSGVGKSATHPDTDNTGFFWFYDNDNLEVGVKVLDGGSINNQFWVYHGAMTTLNYTLTVEDTQTGATKVYEKTAPAPCGGGDINAFPQSLSMLGTLSETEPTPYASSSSTCTDGDRHFCLLSNRFKVQVKYNGIPQFTRKLSDMAGDSYFFSEDNREVFVKMIDGGGANGKFWAFFGSMTDQNYNVIVTDTLTGIYRSYYPPAPNCGLVDTGAFVSQ